MCPSFHAPSLTDLLLLEHSLVRHALPHVLAGTVNCDPDTVRLGLRWLQPVVPRNQYRKLQLSIAEAPPAATIICHVMPSSGDHHPRPSSGARPPRPSRVTHPPRISRVTHPACPSSVTSPPCHKCGAAGGPGRVPSRRERVARPSQGHRAFGCAGQRGSLCRLPVTVPCLIQSPARSTR
jgi:hypothetical protein